MAALAAWAACVPVGGIGASLTVTPGQPHPEVAYTIAGSPADAVGIAAGARLMAVDGADLARMTVEQAVERIRGPVGTKLCLTVLSEGLGYDVDVMRADTSALGAATAKTVREVRPGF